MASKSDHELISQIQGGRRNALGELFDRYSPVLYDFIYRIIGDRDQTARLLEEVFERVPSSLSSLDSLTPVRGWLYGLARECSLTILRQKEWLDALPASDEPSVSGLAGDIWRAARSMPAFHRAVLAVEELHGLSPTEKSRALGVARTDLARLLEDARRSFESQFDLQARQQGRPQSSQIDPERIWGMHRRIGGTGSLFGFLSAVVLPDSLAAMVRAKVLKSARLGAPSLADEIETRVEEPAPIAELRIAEPRITEPPVPDPSEMPPPLLSDEPSAEVAGEGCAWRLVGIALLVALVVTALAVGVGYLLTRDTSGPVITRVDPSENAVIPADQTTLGTTTAVRIAATYRDDRGVDTKATRLVLDGRDVSALSLVTDSSVSYNVDLDPGVHVVLVEVRDTSSNKSTRAWQFTVGPVPESTATPTLTPTNTLIPTIPRAPTPTGTATLFPVPTILDFSATQTVITRGQPVLLTWNVTGADQVFLNQDKVDPFGSRLISPNTTTIYHLIANNIGGTVEKAVTITIQELPDLIVSDISIGPTNQIMFIVTNVGTAGLTRPFLIQVSANSVVVESDRPVSALPSGQQATLVVPNYTVSGSQVITVRLNMLQEIQESDYSNNELTRTLIGPTATPTSPPTPTFTPTSTSTPTLTNTPTPTKTPTNTPTTTNTPTPTFTATSTNTPSPTQTRTPTATTAPFAVTNIIVSVTPITYTGACPGTFNFSANITANSAGTVTFHWERSDGISKTPAMITFSGAGTLSVTDAWASAPTGLGWQALHVTAPNDYTSNQAPITNNCK